LQANVLREAAEVEETKGLIRPVTLNLCGLVLSRFATGLPGEFRPGRLIGGFVRESIFQKEIAEVSPVLLPKLISPQITKQPKSLAELADGTGLTEKQVQGAMFKLGEPDRAIVRPLDPKYTVWEISHDFLVPIIDSLLAQWRVSFWKKVRPWVPLASLAVLFSILLATRWIYPDPIGDLSKHGWVAQARLHPKDGHLISYGLSFSSIPPPRDDRDLKRISVPFAIRLSNISTFDSEHFAWKELSNLTKLDLSRNEWLDDITAMRDMSQLTSVDLLGDTVISNKDLSNLPRSLTTLDLNGAQITDAGIKDLPRSLISLDLRDTQITDAGIKDLPRSLTTLDLNGARITDAGIKDLPRSLTTLDLNGAQITDAEIKDLPRSLTALSLAYTQVTDAGIFDLPSTLTSLDLVGDHRFTDAGIKNLPSSLTSLDLYGTKVTEAGIQSLPPRIKFTR